MNYKRYIGKSVMNLEETGTYYVTEERDVGEPTHYLHLWFVNDLPAVESEKWWESKENLDDWIEKGFVERCPEQLEEERRNKIDKIL